MTRTYVEQPLFSSKEMDLFRENAGSWERIHATHTSSAGCTPCNQAYAGRTGLASQTSLHSVMRNAFNDSNRYQ